MCSLACISYEIYVSGAEKGFFEKLNSDTGREEVAAVLKDGA